MVLWQSSCAECLTPGTALRPTEANVTQIQHKNDEENWNGWRLWSQTQVGLLLLSKVKLFPSKVTDGKFYVGLELTIRSS